MVGMEVGHRVITLVPVHVDDDPVERADTRHGLTIADSFTTRRIADLFQDGPAVPYNAESVWLTHVLYVSTGACRSSGSAWLKP